MKPLLSLVVVAALTACAREGDRPASPAVAAAFKASCATPSLGVCTEYSEDAFLLGEEVLKSTCAETKGTWSPARCPADRKLGGCAMTGQLRVYYPGGDFDYSSDTAQKDCTELFQGRWVASR